MPERKACWEGNRKQQKARRAVSGGGCNRGVVSRRAERLRQTEQNKKAADAWHCVRRLSAQKIFQRIRGEEGDKRKIPARAEGKNNAANIRFQGKYILFLTCNIAKIILIQYYRFFDTEIASFSVKHIDILIFSKNMIFFRRNETAHGNDRSVQIRMRTGKKL